MKASPRSFSPLVMLSAAIVWWVLVLSITLRILLGASATGGWLIVGGIFTFVAFGVAVLVQEFNEAVLIPMGKRNFEQNSRGFPVPVGPDESGFASWEDQLLDRSRRSHLGLGGARAYANRPRSLRNTRTGQPIDFRAYFLRTIAAGQAAA